MNSDPLPNSEIILYQTEDGRTRVQCRFEDETLWLTQAQIAELFEKDLRTINEHLVNIFEEGELRREATIRKFRIVRFEGNREVARHRGHSRRVSRHRERRCRAAARVLRGCEIGDALGALSPSSKSRKRHAISRPFPLVGSLIIRSGCERAPGRALRARGVERRASRAPSGRGCGGGCGGPRAGWCAWGRRRRAWCRWWLRAWVVRRYGTNARSRRNRWVLAPGAILSVKVTVPSGAWLRLPPVRMLQAPVPTARATGCHVARSALASMV